MLMGNAVDSLHALPLLDEYLERKNIGASRVQVFIAAKAAEICRLAVHTRSFEYLLLHVIRTAIHKRCRKLSISTLGVTL